MRLYPALVFAVFASADASDAVAAPALVSSESTHPGIVHEVWAFPGGGNAAQARVHVVSIDLTSQEIALYATKEDNRGATTTEFSSLMGAQVAINGDAFAVAGYRPRGLAMGDKMQWSATADDARSAIFHLRRAATGNGERTIAGIITPELTTALGDLPPETESVISGRPLLIRAGDLETDFHCEDPSTLACQRAPQSALALSADGNTLWLVVVDGWQTGSIGMTASELAQFLRSTKNPYMAMMLDGGSSATLVLDGDVANSPSDGIERHVANHLAVKFGALPKGQLTGVICKNDVIACREDPSLRLPGAEVTLDDGRVQVVTAPEAQYNFPGITPRLACVTVRLAGYKTKTACDTVPSGGIQFESVALEEGMDPPDAGAGDGGITPADAADGDGGVRPDGGDPGLIDGGGGCCGAGGRSMPAATAGILAGLVGFMLRRRRSICGPLRVAAHPTAGGACGTTVVR